MEANNIGSSIHSCSQPDVNAATLSQRQCRFPSIPKQCKWEQVHWQVNFQSWVNEPLLRNLPGAGHRGAGKVEGAEGVGSREGVWQGG